MDESHHHDRRIRDLYSKGARREGRVLAAALTPETRWVIAGTGSLAGTCVGTDAIFDLWRRVAQETGGGLRLTLLDVLANETRAVALVQVVGRRDGRSIELRQVAVFEFAGATLLEARFIYADQASYAFCA